MYLDESDFDEIKRQKRQINPWTPTALIDNVVSLIKNGISLSKPKIDFYNHSTVINTFIKALNHVPIWNESLGIEKRQNSYISFSCGVDDADNTIDSLVNSATSEEAQSFCSMFSDITTISAVVEGVS